MLTKYIADTNDSCGRVMLDNLAVSDLSRVISWLMLLRFEHSTLWICVEQRIHSAMAATLQFTFENHQRLHLYFDQLIRMIEFPLDLEINKA